MRLDAGYDTLIWSTIDDLHDLIRTRLYYYYNARRSVVWLPPPHLSSLIYMLPLHKCSPFVYVKILSFFLRGEENSFLLRKAYTILSNMLLDTNTSREPLLKASRPVMLNGNFRWLVITFVTNVCFEGIIVNPLKSQMKGDPSKLTLNDTDSNCQG